MKKIFTRDNLLGMIGALFMAGIWFCIVAFLVGGWLEALITNAYMGLIVITFVLWDRWESKIIANKFAGGKERHIVTEIFLTGLIFGIVLILTIIFFFLPNW